MIGKIKVFEITFYFVKGYQVSETTELIKKINREDRIYFLSQDKSKVSIVVSAKSFKEVNDYATSLIMGLSNEVKNFDWEQME